MANFKLNVNTDAAIILTAKLERMHRSAMPSAIRSTLNDAAFTMKKTEILVSAKNNMNVKNPAFFKRFTGLKRANGFNVNSMYSEVGFLDRGQKSAIKAINKGMESNEFGGKDDDGGMYIGKSRNGKGLVRRSARFDKTKVLKTKSKSNIARMYASEKSKKQVFINTSKGRFLVQVNSFERGVKGSGPDIKLDFLMRHRKQHIAKAKATHFNQEAALKTQKQMDNFYLKNANYQFSKIWKK